ncbi:glycoside hydrolase family 43 protein [Bombardia bombarda]|uniref:Arabinan endo-1,5-alpha-L-arabinosidase n=1 Tax=Bombardia bombarda TaxID=252184 RepID=A0AA39X0Q8_9PEZI|nr:glycoside hydrolase family 43 protein [Bombardia bombarda]
MMRLSIFFKAFLLLPAATVDSYATPEACSTCTNAHDPSIIRRTDGTYFRFSTGGKIAIHTAPDLVGPWTYKGAVVPSGSSINLAGNQGLWAPDVTKIGDLYYLYYSVSSFGSQNSAIGLARSSSMDAGSWTDVGAVGVTSTSSKSYNAIDANLVQHANGTYFMAFGSWWNGLHMVQMSATPKSTAGTSAFQLSYDGSDKAEEGAYMFKYGSYYYLFYSKGTCCGYDATRPAAGKEYRILVCRSTSLTGGFVDKSGKACTSGGGTVVLPSHDWVYGPGGQGVYQDPRRGPVIYYHYVDTRVGYADGQKRFGWNKLDFSSGWPVV